MQRTSVVFWWAFVKVISELAQGVSGGSLSFFLAVSVVGAFIMLAPSRDAFVILWRTDI